MFNLTEADKLYNEILSNDSSFDHNLVMKWRKKMPDEFAKAIFENRYGHHIFDESLYNEAVSYLKNPDGTTGPHWTADQIESRSGIDFSTKKYTLWDFAYVVNMLYSDYSNIFTDSSYYMQMAKNYLEDSDYFGDPSERAYCNALDRIKYFTES